MWDKLQHQVSTFGSAVLTARDANGYPMSVRTAVHVDDDRHELRVEVPAARCPLRW